MIQNKISIFIFIISLTSANSFASTQLIFSIDLIRHGDRAPLYEIPKSFHFWKEGLGGLTKIGDEQERKLGEKLRMKYIHHYHLLPKIYDEHSIYVRSTDTQRTIKSAESVLLGLYPLTTRERLDKKIPIHVVTIEDDNLLSVKPDKSLFSLINRYFENLKAWKNKTINLQYKLKYWEEVTGLPLTNFPQLERLADNLYIRKLNHLPLPSGIQNNDADEIISLREYAIISKFKMKDETLPMGREFLKTVAIYLEMAVKNKTSLKFVLFSGHDSSIMSVMNTLGSPLNKIPGYASNLNFSLFKNDNSYFVKVSYNDKPVAIQTCGGTICTLSQFDQLIKDN